MNLQNLTQESFSKIIIKQKSIFLIASVTSGFRQVLSFIHEKLDFYGYATSDQIRKAKLAMWKCGSCDSINADNMQRCEVCGLQRGASTTSEAKKNQITELSSGIYKQTISHPSDRTSDEKGPLTKPSLLRPVVIALLIGLFAIIIVTTVAFSISSDQEWFNKTPTLVALPNSNSREPVSQTESLPSDSAYPQNNISPSQVMEDAQSLSTTGVTDPEEFAKWYFTAVWKDGELQNLWNSYLTESFQKHSSPGGYKEYSNWWSSVDKVELLSVEVMEIQNRNAWIRVKLTFHLKDGRVLPERQYDYDLIFNTNRNTWMFDYHR